MNNENVLTHSGAIALERIMRTCTPSLSNGGKRMKVFLEEIVERTMTEKVLFSKLIVESKRFVMQAGVYNVYQAISDFAEGSDIAMSTVYDFFSGPAHIKEAAIERDAEELKLLDSLQKDKYFFSHILQPVIITKVTKKGLLFGVYCNGSIRIAVRNMRVLKEFQKEIVVGNFVLVHYSCIVDVIDKHLAEKISAMQAKEKLLMQVAGEIAKTGIDHSEMAYDPWCEKITL